MTRENIAWLCIASGSFYAIGLAAFPQLFNNWILCPRWGAFGPPASRMSGISGAVGLVGLGLIHLNAVHPFAPIWLPWVIAGAGVLVALSGWDQPAFYRGKA